MSHLIRFLAIIPTAKIVKKTLNTKFFRHKYAAKGQKRRKRRSLFYIS